MKVEHDLSPVVRAWLKGTNRSPYGAQQTVSSVMERVPDVPQRRRRRWSVPLIGRSSAASASRSTGGPAAAAGLSMRSALRFAAAAVIVTLFGGVLLAGVLTSPRGDETTPAGEVAPSPLTTAELVSGMVTEEVAPGVLRILNDGVRDLADLGGGDWGVAVKVDGNGMVWRIVDGRYFRLGGEGEWPVGQQDPGLAPGLAIADGRLVTGWDELTDLLGPQSATPEELGLDGEIRAVEAQADGTLWLLGDDGDSLVRVPPGGVAEAVSWKGAYDGWEYVSGLVVTPAGDAWLMVGPLRTRKYPGVYPDELFLHFDGEDWQTVPVPDVPASEGSPWITGTGMFDVGPDGTLWTMWDRGLPHRNLARYDGSGWTIFGEADGVRPWGEQWVYGWNTPIDAVRVAPDGSVWVIATGAGEDRCGGLGRFDGKSWAPFLPSMCIAYFDIAPDGAVWVVASDREADDAQGTYVIAPEAVATSE